MARILCLDLLGTNVTAKNVSFDKGYSYSPSDINWFWEFIKKKYGDALKNALRGADFNNWVKELHETQILERCALIPERKILDTHYPVITSVAHKIQWITYQRQC